MGTENVYFSQSKKRYEMASRSVNQTDKERSNTLPALLPASSHRFGCLWLILAIKLHYFYCIIQCCSTETKTELLWMKAIL